MLLEELKRENKKVLELLDDINFSDVTEVKHMREYVINHLRKEEEKLYPVVLNSQGKSETGKMFLRLMKSYSNEFDDVTNKLISSHGKPTKKVLHDFDYIKDLIRKRVLVDDKLFFSLYIE
ncbi:hypothetical protein JXM83_01825 [Candidatus Woesearchaeota archaeon]|nr:hypothetical protein [Candidatus Woesearchaeota archaeon]